MSDPRRRRHFRSPSAPGQSITLDVVPDLCGDGPRVLITTECPAGTAKFSYGPKTAAAIGAALLELAGIAVADAEKIGGAK